VTLLAAQVTANDRQKKTRLAAGCGQRDITSTKSRYMKGAAIAAAM
jgi:hypothetical protein